VRARLTHASAAHDPPETTGLDSRAGAAEDDEGSGDAADPCADPDSPEALDPEPVDSEPDSPVPEAAAPDPDVPAPPDPDSPAALDCGAWAGAWREPDEPAEVPADEPVEVPAESLEPRCWVVEACAVTALPGKALAATAVSAPARAALPAISQRLARASRRIAASRVRVVWGLISVESRVEFIGSVCLQSTSSG
jgi:hypothetical protein